MKRHANLVKLILMNNCKNILEIGTCRCINALPMIQTAQAFHQNVEYHGIDLFAEEMRRNPVDKTYCQGEDYIQFPMSYKEALATLKETGAWITLHEGDSKVILANLVTLVKHPPKFDLIRIDGDVSYEGVLADWKSCELLMHEKTIVVFDTYFEGGYVEKGVWGPNAVVDEIDRKIYDVELLDPADIVPPLPDRSLERYKAEIGKKVTCRLVKVTKRKKGVT